MIDLRMREVKGPRCMACGCRDSAVLDRQTRFGTTSERRQCRHCGKRWWESKDADDRADQASAAEGPEPRADMPVVYHRARVQCPKCSGSKTRITSTRGTIRHHKCSECGHCFKSFER